MTNDRNRTGETFKVFYPKLKPNELGNLTIKQQEELNHDYNYTFKITSSWISKRDIAYGYQYNGLILDATDKSEINKIVYLGNLFNRTINIHNGTVKLC